MADELVGHDPERFVTTGLPGLDAILGGLRLGDNVVWRVDSIDDYRAFIVALRRRGAWPPTAASSTFGSRRTRPWWKPVPRVPSHHLDALRGFESFTVRLHTIIAQEGKGVFYVFDCLSDLLDAWATDGMIANFFRVTCPYLFELDTIAYFALERGAHSFATIDAHSRDHAAAASTSTTREASFICTRSRSGSDRRPRCSCRTGTRTGNSLRSPSAARRPASSIACPDACPGTSSATWTPGSGCSCTRPISPSPPRTSPERQAMVAQLCRLLIGRDERILALARRYLTLDDLLDIKDRLIGTGFIGGKAVGMLLARAILHADAEAGWGEFLEQHDSFYIGSDLFHSYIVINGWWQLFMWQRSDAGYFSGAAQLRELHPPRDASRRRSSASSRRCWSTSASIRSSCGPPACWRTDSATPSPASTTASSA